MCKEPSGYHNTMPPWLFNYLQTHWMLSISANCPSMSLTEDSSKVHNASICLLPSNRLWLSATSGKREYLTGGRFFSSPFLSPLALSTMMGYRWMRYRKPFMTPKDINRRTSKPAKAHLFSVIHSRSVFPWRREQYSSNSDANDGCLVFPPEINTHNYFWIYQW